jgi:arsenate reductase-like glutaredoxin family protein
MKMLFVLIILALLIVIPTACFINRSALLTPIVIKTYNAMIDTKLFITKCTAEEFLSKAHKFDKSLNLAVTAIKYIETKVSDKALKETLGKLAIELTNVSKEIGELTVDNVDKKRTSILKTIDKIIAGIRIVADYAKINLPATALASITEERYDASIYALECELNSTK